MQYTRKFVLREKGYKEKIIGVNLHYHILSRPQIHKARNYIYIYVYTTASTRYVSTWGEWAKANVYWKHKTVCKRTTILLNSASLLSCYTILSLYIHTCLYTYNMHMYSELVHPRSKLYLLNSCRLLHL